MIESLETRRLLAASFSVTGSTNKSINADKIVILQTPAGKIRVSNVGATTFTARLRTDLTSVSLAPNTSREFADVAGITISSGAGADTVQIDPTVQQGVTINAGAGSDSVVGGVKNDSILGGENNDTIDGGAGDDSIYGQSGNDSLLGNAGNDRLYGDQNNDTLRGGDNDDYLEGGANSDSLAGDTGTDRIANDGDQSPDNLDGGAGNDFCQPLQEFNSAQQVTSTDTQVNVENVASFFSVFNTSGFNVLIVGGNLSDVVDVSVPTSGGLRVTMNGFEQIYTPAVVQTFGGGGIIGISIFTQGGDDRVTIADSINLPLFVYAGAGNDVVIVGSTGTPSTSIYGVQLNGGSGNDSLVGGLRADLLSGDGTANALPSVPVPLIDPPGSGNDTLVAGDGDDYFVSGGPGDDKLFGGNGTDSLYGDDGNDKLDGGRGPDLISGGIGGDAAMYDTRTTAVVVDIGPSSLAADADDGETGEKDDVKFDTENIVGGSGNDTLIGSSTSNFINGMLGNDRIDGQAGNDILLGDIGSDAITGGSGKDSLDGGRDNDFLFGQDTELDTLNGGAGVDKAFSDVRLDVLIGVE